MYMSEPFAYGKAVNISTEPVGVTPSVNIKGVTDGQINSPQLIFQPGDTATASFFITIPGNYNQEKGNFPTLIFM